MAELTRNGRLTRRPHPDNERLTVIYNHYMNTLMGDPTTERLLPLVDTTADAVAEAFCIDAGWYARRSPCIASSVSLRPGLSTRGGPAQSTQRTWVGSLHFSIRGPLRTRVLAA